MAQVLLFGYRQDLVSLLFFFLAVSWHGMGYTKEYCFLPLSCGSSGGGLFLVGVALELVSPQGKRHMIKLLSVRCF